MPVIHTWQPTASLAPILQSLQSGDCVVLPTESTYEVAGSAIQPRAMAQLHALAVEDAHPAVVMLNDTDWHDWMPWLRGAGLRLVRKLGPGPFVLQANGGYKYGLWSRLAETARQWLVKDELLGSRWPGHAVWPTLRPLAEPLICVPLATARTADDAAKIVGNRAACVVDAGCTEFGTLPAVIRVEGRHCRVQREGVLTTEEIRQLTICRIVFLCTGNTCRSPMAEGICRKLLADGLGCAISGLEQKGYRVDSAGLAAMAGCEASADAVTVLAQQGIDLSSHRSRSATMEMLSSANFIFTMTSSHKDALMHLTLTGMAEPRLLSPWGEDVVDPIGGELADYQACAKQIQTCLHQRLPELLES